LLQKETQQLRQKTEQECADALARSKAAAEVEATGIISSARKEGDILYKSFKLKIDKEREAVLNEARLQAENEAKAMLADARKKTDIIEAEARERALKAAQETIPGIIAEAKRNAEWQAADIITEARSKAREVIRKGLEMRYTPNSNLDTKSSI
jgi:F0F1-type ATP synthase membrane subunit b/b'